MISGSTMLVLILTLLLGLQPVTTDLYLPALPALATEFGAPIARAQLTLSALLLSFGASQVVWGPVSDRFGRKPVLVAGLSVYVLSALGSVTAGDISELIAWRVLQGIAMGAVVMCSRAVVRDLFDDPAKGARVMSQGLTGLGIIASISTPIGGVLASWLGWQSVFVAMAALGFSTLVLVSFRLSETIGPDRRTELQWSTILASWRAILTHPTFWVFALLQTATFGGLFVFLATSSFVFMAYFGLAAWQYGAWMFSMSLFYIVGTFLCRYVLPRIGLSHTVRLGGTFSVTGGLGMLIVGVVGAPHPVAVMVPYFVYIIGHGINQPCSQSGVMGPFPRSAGTASALSSAVMVGGAFIVGQIVGQVETPTPLTMGVGVGLCGALTAAVAWGLVSRVRA